MMMMILIEMMTMISWMEESLMSDETASQSDQARLKAHILVQLTTPMDLMFDTSLDTAAVSGDRTVGSMLPLPLAAARPCPPAQSNLGLR